MFNFVVNIAAAAESLALEIMLSADSVMFKFGTADDVFHW